MPRSRHRARAPRPWAPLGLAVALALLLGCGDAAPEEAAPSSPPSPAAAPAPAPPPPPPDAADDPVLVVFLGDSLTAGYGLDADQAFPHLVGERLAAEGLPVRVVNAGVSGDTTAGGLARLEWVLRQEPDVLVVSLGANDGLRGLPLDASEANLRTIVERARQAGARVLLGGMLIPPNYGPEYTSRFRDLYPRIAAELDVPLVPFLLSDVAAVPDLNLADGIHPNAEGHRAVAATVLPYVRELVGSELVRSELTTDPRTAAPGA